VRWARKSPRPVVLFLDEIDSLLDEALLSVLRQLRSGYGARPEGFPHSVTLIGLRDVRDYSLKLRPVPQSLGTSSPFNIKVESLTLRNFTVDEVAELYEQHTADTGQPFTPEAKALAWELTRGQPWLVNALARQAVETFVPDPSQPVTAASIEAAKERLIQRRDTHLDSLIERLRDPRVRRVIEPIVSGDLLAPDVLDDDIQLTVDLGLVAVSPQGLEIANPIYREIVPRALTSVLEHSLPVQSVGSGRVDLCIRWPTARGMDRWAVEIKVWRQGHSDPLPSGLEQLAGYLSRLGLDRGALVLFDARPSAPPLPARCSIQETEPAGRKITVLRL
jgi:hypothetical protein